jgi:hypothetical protein
MSFEKEKAIYRTLNDLWYELYNFRENIEKSHSEYNTLSILIIDIDSALCEFHKYLRPDKEKKPTVIDVTASL